ncbi:hypothetical protein [Actinophytocola sp. KF-1]
MTEPWAQSCEILSSAGRSVLRGLAAVGAHTFETNDVAPLGDLDHQDVAPTLTDLARGGWVSEVSPGRWTVTTEAEHLVASLAEELTATTATVHVRAFTRHLAAALADAGKTPLDTHRQAAIVAAVAAAGRLNLVDEALTLAMQTWRATTPRGDWAWWHTLAHVSEEIATEAHEADRLIDLLQESGTAYTRSGAGHRADRQWRRAFVLADATHDRRRAAALLLLICERRRSARLFGQALTVCHELIRLYDDTDDHLGLAEALTETAVTLLRGGRRDDAGHYLDRALDTLVIDAPSPREVSRHAQQLVTIGLLWEELGSPATAMPVYSRALAELVDVDDEAADDVRDLLAAVSSASRGS